MKARAFIGYCETACIHLGTKNSGVEEMDVSTAFTEPARLRAGNEIMYNIGTSGLGVFGATLNGKLVLAKPHRAILESDARLFDDNLRNSRTRPLLLYDTESKRGWLVPECSVLLHLAHAWALKQPDKQSLLRKIPLAEPSWNGGQAAFDQIYANRTLQLRSQSCDSGDLDLQNLVKRIFCVVDSRKEEIIKTDSNPIRMPWQKPGLRGWESIDVATFNHISRMKRVQLNEGSGGKWHKISEDNPEVAVLFCKGLGEPIRPSP